MPSLSHLSSLSQLFTTLILAPLATSFVVQPRQNTYISARNSDVTPDTEVPEVPTINGWTADDNAFCYGLPGSLLPFRNFDPLGFAQKGISLSDVKRYREAEVQHGRVAMLATVGYLVGEAASPAVWSGSISGPANDQLAQLPLPFLTFLGLGIGAAELVRARIGWVEPTSFDALFKLRESYYPGDVGFDPLGLKPKDAAGFAKRQTKELQNGRLAMLGVAGMCAQELVNHKTIFETINYYALVYSGSDPLQNAEMIQDAGIL